MNPIEKILTWYFNKSSIPYWCIFLIDCLIVFLSAFFVYWTVHRGLNTLLNSYAIARVMLVYLAVSIVSFRIFHTYSGIVRYSSFVDLARVAYANLLSGGIVFVLHYWINTFPQDTFAHLRAVDIAGTFVVATLGMWAVRVIVKMLYDVMFASHGAKRVFIYGVKKGGVGLAKGIRTQKPTQFLLKGFISHDKNLKSHHLMGVKVYNVTEELPDILKKMHIDAVLVSPQRTERFRNDNDLQGYLNEANIKIYMTTRTQEWDGESGSDDVSTLREVSIDELLPRDEIKVDMQKVGEMLTGKRILITGSAGSIGSEMVRQIAPYNPSEMILIDQAETPQHDIRLMMKKNWPDIKAHAIVTSITKKDRMEEVFKKYKPEYVFHAAAYKHVPMMEDNPRESIQNNVYGTKILADLADKYGVKKFVMISTDKAVNPTNVMGCSKRICEIYVQSLNQHSDTQFVTTRFGNVLGSNGSVIPLFEKQIKAGGPVTVTDPNIIRFFMLIPEACKLVLEAGTMGKGGEIFVFDMGKPVKIADLAKRMILLSGAQNIEIKYTGLRPGEKLYEEVLSNDENTKPSFHEKIRIASVREYDYDSVCKDIDELIAISHGEDDMATVKKMKEIVPEYKSNNSIYSALD